MSRISNKQITVRDKMTDKTAFEKQIQNDYVRRAVEEKEYNLNL